MLKDLPQIATMYLAKMRAKPAKMICLAVAGGFTIVELLLSTVLGALIVASIGGVLLVSEIRLVRNSVQSQNLVDNSNQAANLILREIIEAAQVSTTISSYPASCPTSSTTKLVLIGKGGAWQSIYGISSVASGSSEWAGPARLIRCGPPYTISNGGTIEIGSNVTQVESTILDNLVLNTGFNATINAMSSTTLSRGVEFSISTQLGNGPISTTQYQGRTAANPIYGLYDLIVQNPSYCTSTPCKSFSNTDHFLAPSGTQKIVGNFNREEIIYFPGNIENYTTVQRTATDSSACSRISCFVSGTVNGQSYATTLEYFNVLVFANTERRL